MKRLIFLFIVSLNLFTVFLCEAQWQQVYTGNFNSVNFLDANNGIACGNNGVIVKSINGGINWIVLNSGTTVNLNVIKYFTSDIVLCGGDYQLLLRSTNAGLNWSIVYPQSTINHKFDKIFYFGPGHAKAFSYGYTTSEDYCCLYNSTDDGSSWQASYLSSYQCYFRNMHFVDYNMGWVFYYNIPPSPPFYNKINKTTNGGNSWYQIFSENGGAMNIYYLYFYDAGFGIKVSGASESYAQYQFTVTGGTIWYDLLPQWTTAPKRIFFFNRNTGWNGGYSSFIRATTNGGNNWSTQQFPPNKILSDVFFIDSCTGWIAAGNSGIYKTTNGGVTPFLQIIEEVPVSYSLSQNYPNPFNPSTLIRINVGKAENGKQKTVTELAVYDITGRLIQTLLKEELQPGTYEVTFDGSGLNSGVYFYKLTAGNFTETKRMLLIK